MNDINAFMEKRKNFIAVIMAAMLFFGLIVSFYTASGRSSKFILSHNAYDSFTLQAMAWRRGETKLDKNYPYLELAIINREWLSTHDKDDYMAYRETFGDINAPIEDVPGNEYYVSFPQVPAITMYVLSFFTGAETPSNLVSIMYMAAAFVFLVLIGLRLRQSLAVSLFGAALISVCSSALFLAANYMVGGVWFMAQNMSLMLTSLAFWLVIPEKGEYGMHLSSRHDMKMRHARMHIGMATLALSVGCRPFQILYFFFFAYILYREKLAERSLITGTRVTFKSHILSFVSSLRYYISPAIIGGMYMWYNYIRFGDVFEFGHNYLPEHMRTSSGQFGIEYLEPNLNNILKDVPKWTENGFEFSRFGFACWVANPIFVLLGVTIVLFLLYELVLLIAKSFYPREYKLEFSQNPCNSETYFSSAILFVLIIAHFFAICLHSTLGAWQFGSRYTVDILPAVLVLIYLLIRPLETYTVWHNFTNKTASTGSKIVRISGVILLVLLSLYAATIFIFGYKLNVFGALTLLS